VKPDAVIKSVEGYGLKSILHKPFIERISEGEYTELDNGDRKEPLFSAKSIEQRMQRILNEMLENAAWSEDQDYAVADFKARVEEELQDTEEADSQ